MERRGMDRSGRDWKGRVFTQGAEGIKPERRSGPESKGADVHGTERIGFGYSERKGNKNMTATKTRETASVLPGRNLVLAHLVGVRPLIVHNGQMADPMNPFAKALKALTDKAGKSKTDNDYDEQHRVQFLGSLYMGGDPPVPVLPGYFIEGGMKNAAKKLKAKAQYEAGVCIEGDFPIVYDGPKDPDELWKIPSYRFTRVVRIGKNRVVTCRPIFNEWEVDLEIPYDPDLINRDKVIKIMEVLQSIGLGEWWPRYGRFQLVSIK